MAGLFLVSMGKMMVNEGYVMKMMVYMGVSIARFLFFSFSWEKPE